MNLKNKRVGFAITGSFCSIEPCLGQMAELVGLGADVVPVFSDCALRTDTRFYKAAALRETVEKIAGRGVLSAITETEPFGPQKLVDALVIAPCTSNTLGKIAHGINDNAVTMAVKSVLRNDVPVVLAVSTNDGLSASTCNIGVLLNRRNIFFVPFGQDAPFVKERSLVAKFALIAETIEAALDGRQIQPILR